jgi:prolipoprotein diacylglyceryltransferase
VVPTPPGQLVYPTPLLESTIALAVLWILSRVEARDTILSKPFQRFGLYLVLISLERFFVEIFRGNVVVAFGLSEAQCIALGLIAFGAVLMVRVPRRVAA